ncbi:MAG: hypothetical protein VW879_06730 [Opitutae bacterium]
MEQIAHRLRQEIDSLEEFINFSEERIITSQRVQAIIETLQSHGEDLIQPELEPVVNALHSIRERFTLSDSLTVQIDNLIEEYVDLLGPDFELTGEIEEELTVQDPQYGSFDFLEDEEDDDLEVDDLAEEDDSDLEHSEAFQPGIVETEDADTPPITESFDSALGEDEPLENFPAPIEEARLQQTSETNDLDDLFGSEDSDPISDNETDLTLEQSTSTATGRADLGSFFNEDTLSENGESLDINPEGTGSNSALPDDEYDDSPSDVNDDGQKADSSEDLASLFDDESNPSGLATHNTYRDNKIPRLRPKTPSKRKLSSKRLGGAIQQNSKIRNPSVRNDSEAEGPSVNIYADKISVKDLLSNLNIKLPPQDLDRLSTELPNKLQSKSVVALQSSPEAEEKYALIPRIPRFIFEGQMIPCTVKNLVQIYIKLFGDIKDLTRFKGQAFIVNETPKMEWALVAVDPATDSLKKNFMNQNQYLRQLANATKVPSHLLRRRTLVEGVYDLIVGALVLDETWLNNTLDWTSSGTSPSEFICISQPAEGIRIRNLPRTQSHQALGVCPNW